jgi:AcrR family transcriptional regulator
MTAINKKPSKAKPAVEPLALRQRILDTAEQMLESEDLSALSMREVARRAGVTHQAPYHHFADRESILAELVCQGFTELARRLTKANNLAAKADKRRVIVEAGLAYVGFAIDHPGIFRIMFRRELCDATRFPAAMVASERAYAELQRLVAVLHEGSASPVLASTYWAQVHGLASLLVDGPLGEQLTTVAARRAHMRAAAAQFADFVLGPESL